MVIAERSARFVSRRVQMTQMPELVAAMHCWSAMAAVLIAVAVVNNPAPSASTIRCRAANRSSSSSAASWARYLLGQRDRLRQARGLGKKFRLFSSAPVVFRGQHALNLVLAIAMIGFGCAFFLAGARPGHPSSSCSASPSCWACSSSSRRRRRHAGVISMLNSYSGWRRRESGSRSTTPC